MPVIANKRNGRVTLHNTANATYIIVGNNSVSNVAIGEEVLTGARISQIFWGCDAGHWKVTRGANVIAVCSSTGSGHYNFAAHSVSLSQDAAANVSVTLHGASNGFIVIELTKEGTLPKVGQGY
jgi:hypothetical protein